MTRVLSELLGAREPVFHQTVTRLEAASGHTGTDIRLSIEVERLTKRKLKELGLDANDTTGSELYAALQQKVKIDDERLVKALRARYSSDQALHEHIGRALRELPVPRSCFVLKTTVGKRLLRQHLPRHTMKALGYRSLDSMLRHERLLSVFAVAWLIEPVTWQRTLVDSYKKLTPGDFEIRPMVIITPSSARWYDVAAQVVGQKRHNIVALKEFGAVVVLPLPETKPPGAALAALLLALHDMNEVRASSTFLKLCQVKPQFGKFVQTVVTDEPMLKNDLLDDAVPWQIIQRYYARFAERFRADVFEPHIQQADLTWHSVEKALSHLEPSLSFWQHTADLALLHDHQPVSLNVIDAALNFCNQLPFERRIVHYFRYSLWHELVIRYLKHESVEQAVLGSLESQLVEEPALLYS